jgi:hypothetical protein
MLIYQYSPGTQLYNDNCHIANETFPRIKLVILATLPSTISLIDAPNTENLGNPLLSAISPK